MNNKIISCFFVAILLVLTGCTTTSPSYDYTQLKNHAPRSILVIPPMNNSIEPNAPYIYLSTITSFLAEKGYYVFPVAVIDTFLKENGLPTPAEMNTIPLDKIDTYIGADAVLYVTLDDWGQNFAVFSSNTVVKGAVKLVSVKTGELLWDAPINFVQQSNNSEGVGLGALISAVATQIINDIHDNTPQVARQANYIAINNKTRGLLNGPYVLKKENDK